MSDYLKFYAPMKLFFGEDSLKELPKELCGDHIFIVMDRFLYESEIKQQLDELLMNQKVQYFTDFQPNPDVVSMNHAIREIRAFKATTVIGIGGGSTLDIAKFLAVAMLEKKKVEELRETGFEVKTKIKSICIPTTAGTGSEVTNVSVISDYEQQKKSPFVDDLLFADTAILDPELTLTLPPAVTASCGMDTFAHAIEAYWNINANDLSDLLAKEAMQLVFQNLVTCYETGQHRIARSQMLKASLYAGLAFAQTRTTILHAVSFPFTSLFHIPHGLACAILLPSCLRYFGKEDEKLHQLAKDLNFSSIEEMACAIEALMSSMHMKKTLSEHGIKEEDLDVIAEQTLKEKIAYLGPKEVSKEDLIELLKEVLL